MEILKESEDWVSYWEKMSEGLELLYFVMNCFFSVYVGIGNGVICL